MKMKIQCDVCEKSAATVICCADEAALCENCDIQVHAANKLASKHHRLLLQSLSDTKLPRCDICQDKAGLIFCVEDRAVLCEDCDEPIHSPGTLSANHQRFLATGVRVSLFNSPSKTNNTTYDQKSIMEKKMKMEQQDSLKIPSQDSLKIPSQIPPHYQLHAAFTSSSSWAFDDLLEFAGSESLQPHKKDPVELGELEWVAANEVGLFDDDFGKYEKEAIAGAHQVPQLPLTQTNINNVASLYDPYTYTPFNNPYGSRNFKKPRNIIPLPLVHDDDDHFIVPDLG